MIAELTINEVTSKILARGMSMVQNRLGHKGCRTRMLEWEHLDHVSQVKPLGSTAQAMGDNLRGSGRGVT